MALLKVISWIAEKIALALPAHPSVWAQMVWHLRILYTGLTSRFPFSGRFCICVVAF